MTISNLLKGHEKDLGGGFVVRRYLPSAVKQAVGPFIFFDHFGPAVPRLLAAALHSLANR